MAFLVMRRRWLIGGWLELVRCEFAHHGGELAQLRLQLLYLLLLPHHGEGELLQGVVLVGQPDLQVGDGVVHWRLGRRREAAC